MKKWLPYLIGLLIPVMIFVSFIWMVKKRTLVFKDEFIRQGIHTLETTHRDFVDALKQDVFHRFAEIEAKLTSTENPDEMKIFLKNQIVNSSVADNIFITDGELNFKHFYIPLPEDKTRDFRWAVGNQESKSWVKFFALGSHYVAYKDFQDMKIFITINPGFFYQKLKEKHSFIKEEFQATQKNLFLNFSPEQYIKSKVLLAQAENVLEAGKKVTIEIEGDYIFCQKVILTQDQERAWDFNFFLRIVPSQYPLNLWHKAILMITAALIVLMFVMLLIKMKNDSDASEILSYEGNYQGQEFWDRQFITEDEKQQMDEDQALDTPLGEESESESESEDEEYMQIPEEYFNQNKEAPSTELSSLIGEVKGHEEEISRYNALWKKLHETAPGNPKMALSFLDSDSGQFVPHFKTGFSDENPVDLDESQWLMTEYLLKGKSLLINGDAMAATPLKAIFSPEDYTEMDSVLLIPFLKNGEYDGVFVMASEENISFDRALKLKFLIQEGS